MNILRNLRDFQINYFLVQFSNFLRDKFLALVKFEFLNYPEFPDFLEFPSFTDFP